MHAPGSTDGRTLLAARGIMPNITARHLAVLALLEEEPRIQPDEVATRLGLPLIEIEATCRELADSGLFPDFREARR